MCEWCEAEVPTYCQDCGRMVCQDMERGGDDVMASPYVTTSGDLYCWFCGSRNQAEIERMEEEEAEEFGYWDYNQSWYDPGSELDQLEDTPQQRYIGPDAD